MPDPATWVVVAKVVIALAQEYKKRQDEQEKFDRLYERMQDIVREAVEELKAFIVETLTQSEIDECSAHMRALGRNLREYVAAPSHNVNRLHDAIDGTSFLMSRAEDFGLRGLSLYITSTSAHILTLVMLRERNQDPAEQINIAATALEGKAHVEEMLGLIISEHERDLAGVGPLQYFDTLTLFGRSDRWGRLRDLGHVFYKFKYHGRWYEQGTSFSYAVNDSMGEDQAREKARALAFRFHNGMREDLINSISAKFRYTEEGIINPAREVIDSWQQTARSNYELR